MAARFVWPSEKARPVELAPLFNAPLVVQFHALAAIAALLFGAVQLVRDKGDVGHRVIGYAWVLLMLSIAISSFWIHEINQWRGLSLIHLLSVMVLVSVPLGVHAARRNDIGAHRKAMVRIFWSALVVAGLFTLLPGRVMYRVLFG